MLQGEHSGILLNFIKLPFVIQIFVLSIFEWLFYTGYSHCYSHCGSLWLFYVLLYVTLCPFWYCNRLDGEGGLVALLDLSSWCLVMVGRLFLAVPRGCLEFVIVVFPDHTHLLFLLYSYLIC